MKILYTASAQSTGGRDGKVTIENSPLSFDMAPPVEMGGTRSDGVNPEQLFAAGYAACFGSALQHVYRSRKLSLKPADVKASVGIGRNNQGGYSLAVELIATFSGIDQALAEDLVAEAHQVCPYSNATRNNIEVKVSAKVAEPALA